MSALDRIRRATLLDMKAGDVLVLEVEPMDAVDLHPDPEMPHPYDEMAAVVRAELERIGHDPAKIGLLVVTRGSVTPKIIRPE